MRRLGFLLAALATAAAHHAISICGATRETPNETRFLHRQALRFRPLDSSPSPNNRDIGDIAIIEDTNGVVERQNQFNLDNNSVAFQPSAGGASYRYLVAPSGYDAAAASNGAPLAALDDDDARAVSLPFPFPYFGATYNQVFVNSDGNLTFDAAEYASTQRSLGRMTAGPPRIAPLFDDLDPSKTSGGVRVLTEAARVVVSWVNVPEYSQSGAGLPVTFQVALYADGHIQFAYHGVSSAIASAVTGISPGYLRGSTTLVDFRGDPSATYTATVAERFGNSLAIDIVTVAQQFYRTHEDAYDYLAIYNNMNIQAMGDAVAYENTVRSGGTGYHVAAQDSGAEYGSPARLHAILNMGQLAQYPVDPNAIVPARSVAGDTPLTVLGHEAGHLFLAYVSVKDPNNPASEPMLGYQLAHWNFAYDSEASLLEGERIVDQGPAVSPRFKTTATVQGYSPLDQYLMGFRPPTAVPDTFVVTDVHLNGYAVDTSQLHPISGVAFDGARLDVTAANLIQVEGRRTPDDTVAQRHYRFAFILVVPRGSAPSSADLAQVDTYRQQFEAFYSQASSGNGFADTSLKRSLHLSVAPAAGVVAGGGLASGAIDVETPPAGDLHVALQSAGGYASLPSSVTLPAGALNAPFQYSGLRIGVEEIAAIPADPTYETAHARLQVAGASMLKLLAISGDQQVPTAARTPLPDPVVVRLTDVNNLPYPGARIAATPSADGVAVPAEAIADSQGQAWFRWTPGTAAVNQLKLAVKAAPDVSLTVQAGSAVPTVAAVENAASFAAGAAVGGLATILGHNLAGGQTATAASPWPSTLAGVQVFLNGAAVPLLYVSDTQINFYASPDLAPGTATLTVATPSGVTDSVPVSVAAIQPGIFPGGVVRDGDYLEIYCTGLGPANTTVSPTVFVGATPVQPVSSGLAPGFVGLYRVTVPIPPGLSPGPQPVILEMNLQHSNVVNIQIE